MLLNIEHRTTYQYSEVVNYTIQLLRLTPQNGFGQQVLRWEIRVNGHLQPHKDTYGNHAHTLVVDAPHEEISIVASGEVETGLNVLPINDGLPTPIYLRPTPLTEMDENLTAFVEEFKVAHPKLQEPAALQALMDAIIDRVPYVKGQTAVETSAAKAFALGSGVCQDHAHIFIACCRYLGVPARYVSGYLFTPDGSLMESHAWADAWLDDIGWISFDVTNRCRTNGVHVRLATGLDYRDACPISGVRNGGGVETMSVKVVVHQMQQQAQQ